MVLPVQQSRPTHLWACYIVREQTIFSRYWKTVVYCSSRDSSIIGHFWVAFCLCFKTSPGAQPFIWKLVLPARSCLANQTNFHKKVMHQDSFWNRGKRQLRNGLKSTLALRTPHYYGHALLRTKPSPPTKATYRSLTENDSRYCGLQSTSRGFPL